MPRLADHRHFAIVEPAEGKTWAYWGTPHVKAAAARLSGPDYTASATRQGNGFKRTSTMARSRPTTGARRLAALTGISNVPKSNSISRWRRSAAGQQEGRGGPGATDQSGRAAAKGHGNVSYSVSALWRGWRRSYKPSSTPKLNSRRKPLPWDPEGAGGSRSSQADHYDHSYPAVRERATPFMAILFGLLTMALSLDCLSKILLRAQRRSRGDRLQVISSVNTAG